MTTPVLPGQGRVPYTPLPRRQPLYQGPIVVAREEGIVEGTAYGQQIKLLCRENIGDERFTVAERTYDAGQTVEVEQRDSEAIHILKGRGEFRAWPKTCPGSSPSRPPCSRGWSSWSTSSCATRSGSREGSPW